MLCINIRVITRIFEILRSQVKKRNIIIIILMSLQKFLWKSITAYLPALSYSQEHFIRVIKYLWMHKILVDKCYTVFIITIIIVIIILLLCQHISLGKSWTGCFHASSHFCKSNMLSNFTFFIAQT